MSDDYKLSLNQLNRLDEKTPPVQCMRVRLCFSWCRTAVCVFVTLPAAVYRATSGASRVDLCCLDLQVLLSPFSSPVWLFDTLPCISGGPRSAVTSYLVYPQSIAQSTLDLTLLYSCRIHRESHSHQLHHLHSMKTHIHYTKLQPQPKH